MRRFSFLGFLAVSLFAASPAAAQYTGGIFGPVVNDGHKSFQYRGALNPDGPGGDAAYGQRLHYQQAINDDLQWRVVGQTRSDANSDLKMDFFQAELTWQVTPNGQAYQSGFRLDGQITPDSRREQIGLNWMHQWKFNERWQARAIALSAVQFGENKGKGVFLGTRGNISYKTDGRATIGAEMHNRYGSSKKFGSFKNHNHQVGPFVSLPFQNSDWSASGSALFGLSEGSTDTEFRVFIGRKL